MTLTKDTDIEEVLLNFDIEILSAISPDMICTKCRKIMIDPCSVSCGCNLCRRCIEECQNGGLNYCVIHPGVVLDKVTTSDVIKSNINNLMVKCPNILCDVESQLCHMMSHIRSCPFSRCGNRDSHVPDNVTKSHSSAMMLHLSYLRHEMDSMKKKHEEQLKLQQRQIDRLCDEVKDMKRDAEMEQERYERKLEEQKLDMEALQRESMKMRMEMETMKVDMADMKNTMNAMRTESDGRYEKLNLDVGDVVMERMDREKWNKLMRKKLCILEMATTNLSVKLGKLDFGEYIWSIRGFGEKRKDAVTGTRKVIKSEPFYSHRNGYKMCVRVYPNGFGPGLGTHLYLGFVLMKGEYDDVLPWPFMHRVTLSVVNQRTGVDQTRMEYEYTTTKEQLRYILDKATDEKNVGLGYSRFMSLEDLMANGDTLHGDTVCIRCTVTLLSQ